MGAHRHTPAGRRELDRVREQVPDHLRQPVGVADERADSAVEFGVDPDRLGIGRRANRLDCTPHQIEQPHRPRFEPELAADRPRHVEQVVHQPRLCARIAIDGLDRHLAPALIEVARRQHVRPALNRGQRRAQLMRHRHEELILQRARGLRLAPRAPLAIERLRQPLVDCAQPRGLGRLRIGEGALRHSLGVHLAEQQDHRAGHGQDDRQEEQTGTARLMAPFAEHLIPIERHRDDERRRRDM